MHTVQVSLNIPAREFLAYYHGEAEDVVAVATDGRQIRFPARVLRRFMTHSGVAGVFEIRFDRRNKFVGIERVARTPTA